MSDKKTAKLAIIIIIIFIIISSFLFVSAGLFDSQSIEQLGSISLQSSGWSVTHTSDKDFFPFIFDKNSHKSTICLLSRTANSTQELPDKDFYKADKKDGSDKIKDVKIKAEKVKMENTNLTRDYYGYCYTVKDNEKYLKWGENSTTVVYQEQNKIEYQLDWANANVTLRKLISPKNTNWANNIWSEDLESIFVYVHNDSYKFGATDTSNTFPNGSLEFYHYRVESSVPIIKDGWTPYIRNLTGEGEDFIEQKHIFNFTDICSKTYFINETNETVGSNCGISFWENKVGSYIDNETNQSIPIYNYIMGVSFYSDSDIDPKITAKNKPIKNKLGFLVEKPGKSQWVNQFSEGNGTLLRLWKIGAARNTQLGWRVVGNNCSGWENKTVYYQNGSILPDINGNPIELSCQEAKCWNSACYYIDLRDKNYSHNVGSWIALGSDGILESTFVWTSDNILSYDLSWLNVNINLYKKVSNIWGNILPRNIITKNDDNYKIDSRDWNNKDIEQYKYNLTSNQPFIYQTKDAHRNPYVYYVKGKTTTGLFSSKEERQIFDFNDICSRKFDCEIITTDEINEFGQNVTYENCSYASCSFTNKQINDTYQLTVTFYSDKYIDPTITTSEFTTTNSILTNLIFENNFTHLNISGDEPYLRQTGYGLVAYYPFDENNTVKYVNNTYDYGNNNLDGICTNMGLNCSWNASGIYGSAMQFDGTDDCIDLGDPTNFDFGAENYTISAWVRRESFTTNDMIISKDAINNRQFEMNILDSDTIRFGYFVSGTPVYLDSTKTILNSNWNHIVGVRNGNSFSIYINGTLDSSGTTAGSHGVMDATSTHARIGARLYTGFIDPFDGSIDDVMIFSTALNSTEVLAIYNNQSKRHQNQGTQTFKQFNITAGNNTVNVTTENFQTGWQTNQSILETRIGEWDLAKGYNDSINGSDFNPLDNLVGYYHFDNQTWNGENETYIVDWSGLGNNGTITGGNKTDNDAVYGKAMQFDGTEDYIEMPDKNSLDATSKLTVSAWIKPSTTDPGAIVSKKTASAWDTEDGYFISWDIAVPSLDFYGKSAGYERVNLGATAGKLYHIVVVLDSSLTGNDQLKIYVDGVVQSAATQYTGGALTAGTDNLRIGYGASGFPSYFKGMIDEVMIYNRSLSIDEVKELYVKGKVNWNYLNYQNVSTVAEDNNFTISNLTTNLLPEYRFTASSSDNSNQFYSPFLGTNITYDFYTTAGAPADTTPPTFTSISNISIYQNQSISSNFTATDETAFDSFSINNTGNFSITRDGNLTNITGLTTGMYYINVTINDTSNNLASTVIWVNVSAVIDNTNPIVTINSPSNTTYNTPINYTITATDETLLDSCWFTVNGGVSNESLLNTTSNDVYNRSASAVYSDGGYLAQFYCNDSSGNINNTENIAFTIDNTPPYFTGLTNQTIYSNQTLNNSVANATDGFGFGSYYLNSTTTFQINQSGYLSNITGLAVGNYSINITINDTVGNINSSLVFIEVLDSVLADLISPYFDEILTNQSVPYKTGLGYNINASDETLLDTFTVNDTRFKINSTGYLENNTVLGVGEYLINITINDSSNNLNSTTLIINYTQIIPSGSLSGTSPITYGIAGDVAGSETNTGDGDLVYNLYRNNISVSDPDTTTLGAGTYVYIYNTTGGQNYSINETLAIFTLTVNQDSSNCDVYFNETSPLTYPSSFIVYTNCSSAYNIYRNGSSISNNSIQSLGAGTYNFTVLRTDTSNYSLNSDEEIFIISKASSVVSTYLNQSSANLTFENNTAIWLNSTLDTGDTLNATCKLYNNETLINQGITPLSNLTTFNTNLGKFNITTICDETENYTSSFETFYVNITLLADIINPSIIITSPSNASSTTDTGLDILYETSDDTAVDSCWYSNGTYSTNITLPSCQNITNITWSVSSYNVTIWTNDTSGNENSSIVFFTISSLPSNVGGGGGGGIVPIRLESIKIFSKEVWDYNKVNLINVETYDNNNHLIKVDRLNFRIHETRLFTEGRFEEVNIGNYTNEILVSSQDFKELTLNVTAFRGEISVSQLLKIKTRSINIFSIENSAAALSERTGNKIDELELRYWLILIIVIVLGILGLESFRREGGNNARTNR